jgi:hypothetical protein
MNEVTIYVGETLAVKVGGRVADNAGRSASCSDMLVAPLDPECSPVSTLPEELLALLALLFLSFPSPPGPVPEGFCWLLVLALEAPPSVTEGLSRSKPNCSNERLKEVAFAGRVSCSCGGQLDDDMRVSDKRFPWMKGGTTATCLANPEFCGGSTVQKPHIYVHFLHLIMTPSERADRGPSPYVQTNNIADNGVVGLPGCVTNGRYTDGSIRSTLDRYR